MKVTVLDDYQRAFESTDAIKRLSQRVEVEILTEKLATEDAVSALKNSQAIIPIRERTKFTASLLNALSDLEYISQTGSHVYHVDMDAATRLGIVVSLAPGGNSASELAIGLMLAVMRQIPQSDRTMRRGEWPLVLGYVLKGKTLGILGLGKIGTEVAAIGRAFGIERRCLGTDLERGSGGKICGDIHAARGTLEDG
jgi:phosphoglycerate dehydrogenase-like enzyme